MKTCPLCSFPRPLQDARPVELRNYVEHLEEHLAPLVRVQRAIDRHSGLLNKLAKW